ncbi:MAG: hypothetical protein ABI566_00505 [Pseudolysinimonas sp.]
MSDPHDKKIDEDGVPTDEALPEGHPTDPDATDPNPDISTEEIDK